MRNVAYRVTTGPRPTPRRLWPRLVLRARAAVCAVREHDWGPFRTDDYDGPSVEIGNGDMMPLCSRESRPGEWGIRRCRRCRVSQMRSPVRDG